MKEILINQVYTAYIAIPKSSGGDTVNYSIYLGSTSTVFQTGTMIFVADEIWKIQFTPNSINETYILKANDVTIGSKREEIYTCLSVISNLSDLVVNSIFTAFVAVPQSLSTDIVSFKIYKGSDGSIFQSGYMTFFADEIWKVLFIPSVVGETYLLVVNDTNISSKRENFYYCIDSSGNSLVAGQSFKAFIPIPFSSNSDSVSYSIYVGSTGAVLQSGNMNFIVDEIWGISFTPAAIGETYILKVHDNTIDSKRESFYLCTIGLSPVSRSLIMSQSFPAFITIPQSANTDIVTYVIYVGSTGIIIQSGTMKFIADEVWGISFIPTVIGETYIIKVNDITLNSKTEKSFLCQYSSTSNDDLTTLINFKLNFNINITTHDAMLQNLITQNSKRIKKLAGRKFLQTTYDLTASVDDILYDVNQDQMVMLRQYPIISVQSVNIDWNRVWAAQTLLDSTNYVIDPEIGRIRFKYPFTYWYEQFFRYSPQAKVIQVLYTAGYVTIPEDLAYACECLVMADYLEHIASVNVAASNDVIYKPDRLRKSAMSVIDNYKVWFSGE